MTLMAIFQDADKCMRCNGCAVACKREWDLKSLPVPVRTVNPTTRLVLKSQKRVDMGPFVRFTCWHCPDPPCAKGCPLGAITKNANGAVAVNNALCKPNVCNQPPYSKFGQYPCQVECQRGGYPKIGEPYNTTPADATGPTLMTKCILCAGRAGADADLNPALQPLQTRATTAEINAIPDKAHEPACVSSCPAKAMKWDSRDNIIAYLNDSVNGYIMSDGTKNWLGNGSMFWASRKTLLVPPKADPFVEDHVAPMVGSILGSPIAKAALLPTLVIGGLMAIGARKARIEAESLTEGKV